MRILLLILLSGCSCIAGFACAAQHSPDPYHFRTESERAESKKAIREAQEKRTADDVASKRSGDEQRERDRAKFPIEEQMHGPKNGESASYVFQLMSFRNYGRVSTHEDGNTVLETWRYDGYNHTDFTDITYTDRKVVHTSTTRLEN